MVRIISQSSTAWLTGARQKILDTNLYEHLTVEQRKIPPESITGMKENYEERLNKTETTLAHITIIIPRMMTSKMVSLTST